MLRVRFKTKSEDPRPIKFPPPYPYWVSGESLEHFTLIAFADSEEQLLEYFPEAYDLDTQSVENITFSSRFPCPEWFNPYKTFQIYEDSPHPSSSLADGVILPSGKVVLEWRGNDRTFVVYPNIESLQSIQDKQPNRKICFGGFAPDGYHLTTFKLVRKEDVTGVSGTGVVAYGCNIGVGAVLEWCGDIPSIAYYPEGVSQIEKLHGHNGKTIIEEDVTPSW